MSEEPSQPMHLWNPNESQIWNPIELFKKFETTVEPENVISQAPVRILNKSVPGMQNIGLHEMKVKLKSVPI